MNPIDRLHRLDPTCFNRRCAVIGFIFLLITTSGKMIWRFHSGFSPQDFPQYYMAGVIADAGAWDALYPVPNPGSPRNPGFVEDSTAKPRYQQLADERDVGEQVRYMQPPLFALLLMPLGLLSFKAAFIVWNLMNCLLVWGIAVQAGKIYRFCTGRLTHAPGWIILLISFSPEADRWVRVQNVSPLIGWLIGFATIQLLDAHCPMRDLKSALAAWLAGIAKYIGILFVPIYLAMRRWQALAWLIGISAVSLAIGIAISGWGVYHEFIHVIAPTLSRSNALTGNQSLPGFMLRVVHQDILPAHVRLMLSIAQAVVFVILMILLFRRPATFWRRPIHLFAAASALTLWMMIFSPTSWEHYTAYAAPFYGWLIWEATRGPVRRIIAILVIAAEYVPTPIIPLFAHLPEPIASHMLWGLCVMLLLAIWRLMNPVQEQTDEAIKDSSRLAKQAA